VRVEALREAIAAQLLSPHSVAPGRELLDPIDARLPSASYRLPAGATIGRLLAGDEILRLLLAREERFHLCRALQRRHRRSGSDAANSSAAEELTSETTTLAPSSAKSLCGRGTQAGRATGDEHDAVLQHHGAHLLRQAFIASV
jgi:hypothetical protein